MKKAAFSLIFLVVSLSAFSQTRAETLVNKLEFKRFKASVNNDFAFLESILSNSLKYCRSNGVINSKSEYLETIRSGQVIYKEFSPIKIETRQYAKNIVLNRGTVSTAVEATGNDGKPYLLYFTSVYVKEKSCWKIVSIQSTKVVK
jgi:hypothetical protein